MKKTRLWYIRIFVFSLEFYFFIILLCYFFSYQKDNNSEIFTRPINQEILYLYIIPYIFPIGLVFFGFTIIFILEKMVLLIVNKIQVPEKNIYIIEIILFILILYYIINQNLVLSLLDPRLYPENTIQTFFVTLAATQYINDKLKLNETDYFCYMWEYLKGNIEAIKK